MEQVWYFPSGHLPKSGCRDKLCSTMKASILVVTPIASVGEQIRQNLKQAGSGNVQIATRKDDAVAYASSEQFSLALLDMDMGASAVIETGRLLRAFTPDIDLVLLAQDDLQPGMDSIRPWVSLRKPFNMSDFLQLLQSAHKTPSASRQQAGEEGSPEEGFPWLNDVSRAAQHLTRLTLASSAQAALITRAGELWAYAGQLSQNAANELTRTISRHSDGQKGNDLLRFVCLESTKAEHMLYATRLTDFVILALVFDAETPFSTIRSQANELAHSLALPGTGPTPAVERDVVLEPLADEQEWLDEIDAFADEASFDEDDEDVDIPSIADILNEVPPPNPSEPDLRNPITELNPSAVVTRPSTPLSRRRNFFERDDAPEVQVEDLTLDETQVGRSGSVEDLDATVPSKSQRRPSTPLRRPNPEDLEETRPSSFTEEGGRMIVEPISPGLSQLNYACLLAPRFSHHYLTGDLADKLSEWMSQICIAFGWRLEHLAVRPEYLQWVANVTPNTSPGYLMRTMRLQTSQRIFDDFPRLKRENPSGDFWAPGYLIMGGLQPHPPQLIKEYLKQTRKRQGISRSR